MHLAARYGRLEGGPCSLEDTGRGPVGAKASPEEDVERPVHLAGNVWEFVDTDFSDTRGPGSGGPGDAGGSFLKVMKGGAWSSPADQLRSAARTAVQNDYWAGDVGFRCAADPR